MKQFLLECCVDSVESAILAEEGGADRLELCSNLIIGGTTPGIQLYEEVRKHILIPIRVLIRPRFGDFLYSDYEYEIMKKEVIMFREAGADGIVTGCLKADGNFDMDRMTGLMELIRDMKLTVHRAFDMVRNPMEAFEQLKQLGADTLLTSGQEQSCLEGRTLIQRLLESSENKINILAGRGVNPQVIEEMLQSTNIVQFHMSGKEFIDSSMGYRKEHIHMGLPFFSEYQILRTNKKNIMDAKNIFKR